MDTREFFSTLEAKSDPTKLEGVENSYLFDIAGEGRWLVDVHGGKLTVTESPEAAGDVTFSMSGETLREAPHPQAEPAHRLRDRQAQGHGRHRRRDGAAEDPLAPDHCPPDRALGSSQAVPDTSREAMAGDSPRPGPRQ